MSGIEAIPGISQTTINFVKMVRQFMRDQPQLNRLVAGEESNDRQILWAILDALSDFNGTPPLIGNFDLDTLIARNQQYLLLRMTVCSLIESVGLLQTRNQFNYNNGNFSVAVNDKTPLLLQWLQLFRANIEQRKVQVKVSWNIEALLDKCDPGVHSEYWVTNGVYVYY